MIRTGGIISKLELDIGGFSKAFDNAIKLSEDFGKSLVSKLDIGRDISISDDISKDLDKTAKKISRFDEIVRDGLRSGKKVEVSDFLKGLDKRSAEREGKKLSEGIARGIKLSAGLIVGALSAKVLFKGLLLKESFFLGRDIISNIAKGLKNKLPSLRQTIKTSGLFALGAALNPATKAVKSLGIGLKNSGGVGLALGKSLSEASSELDEVRRSLENSNIGDGIEKSLERVIQLSQRTSRSITNIASAQIKFADNGITGIESLEGIASKLGSTIDEAADSIINLDEKALKQLGVNIEEIDGQFKIDFDIEGSQFSEVFDDITSAQQAVITNLAGSFEAESNRFRNSLSRSGERIGSNISILLGRVGNEFREEVERSRNIVNGLINDFANNGVLRFVGREIGRLFNAVNDIFENNRDRILQLATTISTNIIAGIKTGANIISGILGSDDIAGNIGELILGSLFEFGKFFVSTLLQTAKLIFGLAITAGKTIFQRGALDIGGTLNLFLKSFADILNQIKFVDVEFDPTFLDGVSTLRDLASELNADDLRKAIRDGGVSEERVNRTASIILDPKIDDSETRKILQDFPEIRENIRRIRGSEIIQKGAGEALGKVGEFLKSEGEILRDGIKGIGEQFEKASGVNIAEDFNNNLEEVRKDIADNLKPDDLTGDFDTESFKREVKIDGEDLKNTPKEIAKELAEGGRKAGDEIRKGIENAGDKTKFRDFSRFDKIVSNDRLTGGLRSNDRINDIRNQSAARASDATDRLANELSKNNDGASREFLNQGPVRDFARELRLGNQNDRALRNGELKVEEVVVVSDFGLGELINDSRSDSEIGNGIEKVGSETVKEIADLGSKIPKVAMSSNDLKKASNSDEFLEIAEDMQEKLGQAVEWLQKIHEELC